MNELRYSAKLASSNTEAYMKIFANNVEIRPSEASAESKAIVQRHLAAGLDIRVLGFSAAEFELSLDTPTEARAVIEAVEKFILEESRTAFPFPLFSLTLNGRMP
jgi:hypothetical protein